MSTATYRSVIVEPTSAQLATLVADEFVTLVHTRTAAGSAAHICLTGGSMGGAVLSAVAEHSHASTIDWSMVHFWWGDERFVSLDDADRNSRQSKTALLDRVPVPESNVHEAAVPGALSLDEAAAAYADELARFGTAAHPWPAFTVCFLGVGPDGHVASLFPGRPEVAVTDAGVLPVRQSPKPPPERITLTLPVINASEQVWLVLAGSDKSAALAGALEETTGVRIPAAGVQARRRTVFFADEAAAADVSPRLIGDYS